MATRQNYGKVPFYCIWILYLLCVTDRGLVMKARRIRWSPLYAVMGPIAMLALVILNNGCAPQARFPVSQADVAPGGFVTRSGSQLLLNGQPFRFAGANIHWLGLDDSTNYPSQF